MRRFFQLFVDIALWRKGPQDLPASTTLLAIVVMWYVGASYAQVRLLGFGMPKSLLFTAIDIGVSVIWLTVTLSILGFRPRLTQAMTAMLGVGTLLTMLDVIVLIVSNVVGDGHGNFYAWDLLRMVVILLTYGKIFAITTERGLFTGMALAFAMLIIIQAAVTPLLTQATPTHN